MRRRFLTAFVFTGLLVAQRSSVDTAWDLVGKGDRKGAIAVLEQTLKANPGNGEARLLLGSIFTEEGRGAEAIAQLSAAARLMPLSAMAHNALGEALSNTSDGKAARRSFEKAVALDPKFPQARVNLGSALLQAGESEAAARHLDRAIALLGQTPDAAYPLYLRAKVYTSQEIPEKAVEALKQAVALQPDFGEAWSDLGQARKALSDDAGALAAFQRSVEVNPENAVSRYRLGAEYLNQEKAHEAVAHLQASYRINPKNQSTLNSLQLALRQDGQLEEAARIKAELTQLLRAIDKESQDAFAAVRLNNEASALEKTGDLKGAVEKYRSARALNPEHVGIRTNLGVTLLRMGQWQEGLAELREALRRDPENARLKAALDDALRQAPARRP